MNESNEETYYQRNRDVIVNTAKVYYENDKERLKDQVRDKYRNLSEEEQNKKTEYGRKRYHSMSKERIKNLKTIKKITARLKSLSLIICKIFVYLRFNGACCDLVIHH